MKTTSTKLLILVCLMLSLYATAQRPVVQWVRTINEASGAYLSFVTPAAATNSIKTIATNSKDIFSLSMGQGKGLSTSRSGVAINKFNINGELLWRYPLYDCFSDDPSYGRDICYQPSLPIYDFITTQDGGILVFGNRLLAINTDGKMQFESPLRNLAKGIQLTDGAFVIMDTASTLYKIDKNGNQVWKKEYGRISDIQPTSDNGLIVTGFSGTRKIDNQGQSTWLNPLFADYIKQTPDGNYIAWGANSIVKLNSSGQQIWASSQLGINSLVVTNDNGCVVTSNRQIQKISSGGSREWTQTRSENLTVYRSSDDENVLVTRLIINPYNLSSVAYIDKINIKTGTVSVWSKSINNKSIWKMQVLALSDGGIAVNASVFVNSNSSAYLFKLSSGNETCNYTPTISTSTTCESSSGYLYGALGNSSLSDQLNFVSSLVNIQWKKDGNAIIGKNTYDLFADTPGTYSVVISQEGCVIESTPVRIGGIKAPNIASDKANICEGQSITLTSQNCDGVTKWSSGQTGSSITIAPKTTITYTATCEKDNCKSSNSNSITIEVNPIVNVSISTPTSTICPGQEIILTANKTNTNSPISFQWKRDGQNIGTNSNTLTVGEGGAYTVTALDSKGCGSTSETQTIVKSDLKATITSDKTEFCKGGNVTLTMTVSGGIAPFTYQWRNGSNNVGNSGLLNVNTGGNYSATVNDSKGCTAETNRISIAERGTDIIASISAVGATEVFAPATVKLSATTGLGYAYQWQKETQNITGANLPNYEATTSGEYRVMINRDGCSVFSASIKVNIQTPTSISDIPNETLSFMVYPNPVQHEFRAKLTTKTSVFVEFQLIDLQGKIIRKFESSERKEHQINGSLQGMTKGKYFLQAIMPNETKSISITKD